MGEGDVAAGVADAEEEVVVGAAVVFPEAVVAPAFRGAVAAVFRGPAEEISPEEVSVALLGRGMSPAEIEAVVWLIPETSPRAPEVPLDNDLPIAQINYRRPRGTVEGPAEPIVHPAAGSAKDRPRVLARDKVLLIDRAPQIGLVIGT